MSITDKDVFWNLLEHEEAILVLDNDMCYITSDSTEENGFEGASFDFSPLDLVFLFAEKNNIKTEMC